MSENILQEANELINGDRAKAYGSPLKDFARTAKMWSAILGYKVTPQQIPLCMIALKISRECNKHKMDNLVDIAGYSGTLEKVHEELSYSVNLKEDENENRNKRNL